MTRALVVPLAALALVAAGCGGSTPASGTASSPTSLARSTATSPVSSSGAPAARADLRVRVGSKPCGVVIDGPRVWVSSYADSTLRRVDRTSGHAFAPVTVGSQPCGLAVGAGSVWVEDYGSSEVTRVDARTGRVQSTIAVGASPYDVTFAAGAAWVTDNLDGTVSRLDARTNARTVIRTGGHPVGIVAAAGALWVGTGNEIVRIDPRQGAVTDRLPGRPGAGWTAASGDDVWVMNGQDGSVTHVDAAHRTVLRTVSVGPAPLDGDAADGAVWVPLKDGRVVRLDAATDAVTGTWTTGVTLPFVLDADGGQLWTADFSGTDLVRLVAPRP